MWKSESKQSMKQKFSKSVLWIVLCGVALGSCSSVPQPHSEAKSVTTSDVSYHEFVPDTAIKYSLQPGEGATRPELIKGRNPIYPASLLDDHHVPVTVTAKIVADESGHVSSVVIDSYEGNQSEYDLFATAVREAALQWEFTPLLIEKQVVLPNGARGLTTKRYPFSLWYIFTFKIVNGKPQVSASKKPEH